MEGLISEIVASTQGKYSLSSILDQLDIMRRNKRININQFEALYKKIISESRNEDKWFDKYITQVNPNFSFDMKNSMKINDENNPNQMNTLIPSSDEKQQTSPNTVFTNQALSYQSKPSFRSPQQYLVSPTPFGSPPTYETRCSKVSDYQSDFQKEITSKIWRNIEKKRASVSEHHKSVQVNIDEYQMKGLSNLDKFILKKVLQQQRFAFNKIIFIVNEPIRLEKESFNLKQQSFKALEINKKKSISILEHIKNKTNQRNKQLLETYFNKFKFYKEFKQLKKDHFNRFSNTHNNYIINRIFVLWRNSMKTKKNNRSKKILAKKFNFIRITKIICLEWQHWTKKRIHKAQEYKQMDNFNNIKIQRRVFNVFKSHPTKIKEKQIKQSLLFDYYIINFQQKIFLNWKRAAKVLKIRKKKVSIRQMIKENNMVKYCFSVFKNNFNKIKNIKQIIKDQEENKINNLIILCFDALKQNKIKKKQKKIYKDQIDSIHQNYITQQIFHFLFQYPKIQKIRQLNKVTARNYITNKLQKKYFNNFKVYNQYRKQKQEQYLTVFAYANLKLVQKVFASLKELPTRNISKKKEKILIMAYAECRLLHKVLQEWNNYTKIAPSLLKQIQQKRVFNLWMEKWKSAQKIQKIFSNIEKIDLRVFFKNMKLIKKQDYRKKKFMKEARTFYLLKHHFRILLKYTKYQQFCKETFEEIQYNKQVSLATQFFTKLKKSYHYEQNTAFLTAYTILHIKKQLLQKYFNGFKIVLQNRKRPRDYKLRLNKQRKFFYLWKDQICKLQSSKILFNILINSRKNVKQCFMKKLQKNSERSYYNKIYCETLIFKTLHAWRRMSEKSIKLQNFIIAVSNRKLEYLKQGFKKIICVSKYKKVQYNCELKLKKNYLFSWNKKFSQQVNLKELLIIKREFTNQQFKQILTKFIKQLNNTKQKQEQYLIETEEQLTYQLKLKNQRQYFSIWKKNYKIKQGIDILELSLSIQKQKNIYIGFKRIKRFTKLNELIQIHNEKLTVKTFKKMLEIAQLSRKLKLFMSRINKVFSNQLYYSSQRKVLYVQLQIQQFKLLKGEMLVKTLENMQIKRIQQSYQQFQHNANMQMVIQEFIEKRQFIIQIKCFAEISHYSNKMIALKHIFSILETADKETKYLSLNQMGRYSQLFDQVAQNHDTYIKKEYFQNWINRYEKIQKIIQQKQNKEDNLSLMFSVFKSWKMFADENKLLKKYLAECNQSGSAERRGSSIPKNMPY